MNWLTIKNLTAVRIGTFLALLILAFQPNFGIVKYGPSPAVPAFFLFVLGIWFIWKERAALFTAPAQRRWLMVFLLLFVPVAISVPQSFNPRVSLSVAIVLFLYFFAGVALLRALRDDSERAWLAKGVTLVLAFWVTDGIIQFIFGKDLFLIELTPDRRVLGPFADNLHMSTLLALFLPVALWQLLRIGVFTAISGFIAAAAVAMLSGARGVMVYLLIVAAGFYVRLPRFRWKVPAVLAAMAILAVVVGSSPALKERMQRIYDLRQLNFETIDNVLSKRLTIWYTAGDMLADRPLTGVGAGAFAQAYDRYSTRVDDVFLGGDVFHAHQLYIGMAAETGLPGFIGLLLIVVLGLRWYFAAPPACRNEAWPWGLGLALYAFPVNSQPPPFNQWLFPVILLLLAGMLAALDETRTAGAPPASRV